MLQFIPKTSHLGGLHVPAVARRAPPLNVLGGEFYSSGFTTAENPLSDGGLWRNGLVHGLDWNNMKTVGGNAVGAALADGPSYDDPIACLTGFPSDQFIEGVFYKAAGYSPPGGHEAELHLRCTITANSITSYEFLVDGVNNTFQLVRWDGTIGNLYFSLSVTDHNGGFSAPADGDVFRFSVVGSNFSVYQNGTLRATFTDSTYTNGSPGIAAFWLNAGNTGDNLGWKSIVAGEPSATLPLFSNMPGLTENPASLGGALVHPADTYTAYQKTKVVSGVLCGVAFSVGYDDCTVRTNTSLGISNTKHYSKAIVRRQAGYTPGSTHEVELVVLVSETASTLKLYEALWNIGGSLSVVRWNGTVGDFTLHGTGTWTDTPTINTGSSNLQNGDVVEMYAEIISGSPRITVYVNGTAVFQCSDTSVGKLTSGQPGWSFFSRDDPALVLHNYGFSYIEAGNWTALP
jgi:hypothetical protein